MFDPARLKSCNIIVSELLIHTSYTNNRVQDYKRVSLTTMSRRTINHRDNATSNVIHLETNKYAACRKNRAVQRYFNNVQTLKQFRTAWFLIRQGIITIIVITVTNQHNIKLNIESQIDQKLGNESDGGAPIRARWIFDGDFGDGGFN